MQIVYNFNCTRTNLGHTKFKRNYIWGYANKKMLNTTDLGNVLTDGGEVVSLTRRPGFTPKKIFSGTHFF
jgi:hypothetical protein